MRWVFGIVILVIAVATGWYIWDFNDKVKVAADNNNGAVCYLTVQLDEELWNAYLVSGTSAAYGTLTQDQADLASQDVSELLNTLNQISGSQCQVTFNQIPSMQPGRFKAELFYYRP